MTGADEDTDLAKLDAYLCELKEAQIRDGLHIFGQSPTGSSGARSGAWRCRACRAATARAAMPR